jgi:hypothetical protein
VLISERLLFQSPGASRTLIESRTGTVLHEMAHMWFGDSATQEWWDDLWLSESFAEFCEAHAQVDLGLNPDAWSAMSVTMKIVAFADDQLPSAHPVASGASTVSEAIANFDGITYAKGAAVLRQLSAYAGEEAFIAGLRAYVARTAVPSLRGTARPDLILLNDDDTGYVIARFDPRSLQTVLSSVSGLPDLPARAVCWNAVIDMVRQAELPVSAFAAMLARAMRSERLPVLSALWKQAERLITRFATPEGAAESRSLLRRPLRLSAALSWTLNRGGRRCGASRRPARPTTRASTPNWPATRRTRAAGMPPRAGPRCRTPGTRRRPG